MICRPYREDDLPTYEWIHRNVPTTWVHTSVLQPTQGMLDLDRLLAIHHGEQAEGPDRFPHVVEWSGGLWIHNGHHRWVNSLLTGQFDILVRVVELQGSLEETA